MLPFSLRQDKRRKTNEESCCPADGTVHVADGCSSRGLFHAGNLGQLEDFQFQILTIPEAVSLPNQPSDLVVETFRGCVGQMMKCPVGLDPFQIVPNGPSHGSQFGDPGFLSQTAPAMESHIGMPGVL